MPLEAHPHSGGPARTNKKVHRSTEARPTLFGAVRARPQQGCATCSILGARGMRRLETPSRARVTGR